MNHRSFVSFLLFLLPSTLSGFFITLTPRDAPQRPSRLASSITMMNTQQQQQQPLAQHGDWQAYFDEDRYCLMYYFNTKTGDSQWEPPADFPIPKLEEDKKDTSDKTSTPEPATVFFQAVIGLTATVATKATEAIVNHIATKVVAAANHPHKEEEEAVQPWWSKLFPPKKEEPTKTDIVDLLSEINASQQSLPSEPTAASRTNVSTNTARQQAAFWANWNEPTRPVIPPSHREQWIQEKLYADSLKRQENLRKNYRKVIENRSPTISLSALKRENNKDWLQFLNDA